MLEKALNTDYGQVKASEKVEKEPNAGSGQVDGKDSNQ
jgi:hypothetical protein